MDISETINKIKNFDFNKFNWKEAVAGPDGKSSAGKMLCFWYGLALIFGTVLCFVLLVMKHTSAIVTESALNNCFLFIGVQMPLTLGYLLSNKNLEIKADPNKKPGVEPG